MVDSLLNLQRNTFFFFGLPPFSLRLSGVLHLLGATVFRGGINFIWMRLGRSLEGFVVLWIGRVRCSGVEVGIGLDSYT